MKIFFSNLLDHSLYNFEVRFPPLELNHLSPTTNGTSYFHSPLRCPFALPTSLPQLVLAWRSSSSTPKIAKKKVIFPEFHKTINSFLQGERFNSILVLHNPRPKPIPIPGCFGDITSFPEISVEKSCFLNPIFAIFWHSQFF